MDWVIAVVSVTPRMLSAGRAELANCPFHGFQILSVSMSGIRFGILGPLLVEDSTGPRPIAAARQRALLAALLLTAPRPVAAADLADQVWNLEPPAGAAGTLHSYVSRLRTALGPVGDRIKTQSSGYVVELGPGELDIEV